MAREPKLNTWKLAPEKRRVSTTIMEQPLSIPDAPTPGVEPPAALAPVPLRFPFGVTDFAYLYSLIDTLDQGAVAAAGDTMTGTLTINAEPSAHISLQSRYEIHTDNAGTPGHEASGPNLRIKDVGKNHEPLKLLSIGQLQINLKDTVLANNSVAHSLQIRRQPGSGASEIGFGTGVQFFTPDSAGTELEVGNIQCDMASVTPAAVNSRLIFRVMIGGVAGTQILRSTSVGNIVSDFKMLATGGIGVGNRVASTVLTAPGTVQGKYEVFDAAGASLGFAPLYAPGSFN